MSVNMNNYSFMRLPDMQNIEHTDIAIIGIPFSSNAFGCQSAPMAIRMASVGVRPSNPAIRTNALHSCCAIDYGDVPVVPGLIHETYNETAKYLKPLLDANIIPICMGGDHSVTLGEIRAMYNRYGKLSFVLLDSHGDVYDSYNEGRDRYNAGTHIKRAIDEGLVKPEKSIIVGLRSFRDIDDDPADLGISVLTTDDVVNAPIEVTIKQIHERIGNDPVFISFDIDVIDPAYAPGTNSQVPGGFTSRETLSIIRGLHGMSFAGFDIVEVNPYLDPSHSTAKLAAHIMFEFMSLIALRKS
jgi:agmatinase